MTESTTAKLFHIGDVLSITTGKLVSPSRMGGVYAILDHMSGESLMTHQLPRVSDEAEPFLREQFPDLTVAGDESADRVGNTEESVSAWLGVLVERFGESVMVEPMPSEAHAQRNPITELVEMVGPDKPVYVIAAAQSEQSSAAE